MLTFQNKKFTNNSLLQFKEIFINHQTQINKIENKKNTTEKGEIRELLRKLPMNIILMAIHRVHILNVYTIRTCRYSKCIGIHNDEYLKCNYTFRLYRMRECKHKFVQAMKY